MSLASEFKEFAMRGNVVDMAVGIVIGAAFGKIVSSFVADVLMPPLGLLLGGVDFSNLVVTLKPALDAAHPAVTQQFPVIAESLLASSSPQVRNQATMGGNLLQRTRCPYFRDVGYAACNRRAPGSGCSAIGGENRWHAVLGTSENCIAAHASDVAVALVALDAAVEVRGAAGQRSVPLTDFYHLPDAAPHIETVIEPGVQRASSSNVFRPG